jgi:opacity protein-like surface antigen
MRTRAFRADPENCNHGLEINMHIRKLLIALPALFLGVSFISAPSAAQWYVSGNIGAVQVMDADITETGPGYSVDGEFEFDTGFGINGAVGYGFGNVRLEGEVSYRQADFDKVGIDNLTVGSLKFTSLGSLDVDGDASSLGLMGNVWYDFDTGSKWLPFIGGGIGVARVDSDIDSIGGVSVGFSEDDTVFAYQVGAGIGYQISDNAVATLGYRFYGTDDPEFESGGVTDKTEYQSHNIEVGIRFGF